MSYNTFAHLEEMSSAGQCHNWVCPACRFVISPSIVHENLLHSPILYNTSYCTSDAHTVGLIFVASLAWLQICYCFVDFSSICCNN